MAALLQTQAGTGEALRDTDNSTSTELVGWGLNALGAPNDDSEALALADELRERASEDAAGLRELLRVRA